MTHMTSGTDYEYDEPQMERSTIEALWREFGNCCIDDNDRIDSSWCGWEFGTDRFEIWHWFDAQYAQWGGVHALMFPDEHKHSKYGKVPAHADIYVHDKLDYAIEIATVEFDCAAVLDEWELDDVRALKAGESDEDTDYLYYEALELGLCDSYKDYEWYCYVDSDEALNAYIQAREEA